MSTRALGGKTPWQTLYRLPPNLSRSKRFGEAVWVHNPNESKLNPRARKGCWIGFNVKSHGHRVYWPTNKTVSIECSVYFAAADRLEGEKMDVPSSKALTSELLAALLPAPPTPAPDEAPSSPVLFLSLLLSSSSQAVSEVLQIDPPPESEPRCSAHLQNRLHWL